MAIATLRVSALDFKVDEFLSRFSALAPDAIWRRGHKHGPRTAETSGFNLHAFETSSPNSIESEVVNFIRLRKSELEALAAESVACGIDIGLMAGSESQFTSSVSLGVETLRLLADSKVGLTVSAYPSSD